MEEEIIMKKGCFTTRRFSILSVSMMIVFASFLFTSVAANAAPGGNSAGGLPQLQAELEDLQDRLTLLN